MTALKANDHGPAVLQLQRDLVELGFPLPRSTAHDGTLDGWVGDEVLSTVAALLGRLGRIDIDPKVVSEDELQLISELVVQKHAAAPAGPPGTIFHDRRTSALQHFVEGPRLWKNVTGITLHHTASDLGEGPKRWDSIGCHVGITRAGQVIWLHDFNKRVVHGHGWNTQCVGIEMDGWYEGVEGDPRTLWQPPTGPRRIAMPLTDSLVNAARATIRWIVNVVAANGGHVRALVSHRQASSERDADPGSAMWKAIALPMHAELGLHDGGPGFKIGDGSPNPVEWDPSRVGIHYR